MRLQTLPYDKPAPPLPRRPQRVDGFGFALICEAIVVLCIIIGMAT